MSDVNYRAMQADTLRKRATKTCTWVFDNPAFLTWLESDGGMLWGTGMRESKSTFLNKADILFISWTAGAGKTVLA